MGKTNIELFEEAKKYIPGGVNSPVRAFNAVGGNPIFIKSAKGSKLIDAGNREYIDYVCSWGPLILGHSNKAVVDEISGALLGGTSYGAPTEREITLAKLICESVPSIEMVRMVNSGTEAVMSAVRLARGYTKRDLIVKFRGGYHGHADSFLVEAGSGLTTLGEPSSPGVTKGTAQDTILCAYNDSQNLEKIFEKSGKEIAAVIVEPIAGNMGLILPKKGFLEKMRELTQKHDTLLIFDEVISGFRISLGGAQKLYGITPDLTTLGKIIGGGLPVGAYGGRKDVMSHISPLGPVYQAGTLSGNPLAMAAGIGTLKQLISVNPYKKLEETTKNLTQSLRGIVEKGDYPISITNIASMFTIFFRRGEPTNWNEAKACDLKRYAKFFHLMLDKGVYLPPAQFETAFISTAHTEDDINNTMEAFKISLEEVFS